MISAADPAVGSLGWEIIATATGEVVHRGQREIRPSEGEVRVIPPRPRPQLGRLLRQGPGSAAAEVFSWLVAGGRSRTTKRVRLGADFWLGLLEQPGPKRPSGFALRVEREGQDTFSWEWFTLSDDGATATKLQETGSLGLDWAKNRHGHQEVVRTMFATDISLRSFARQESTRREPTWRARVLAGSTVRWPEAADGIKLAPRLLPRGGHPAPR